MLASTFAGVPAGAMMLISSPGEIARYIAVIPSGETRTIARLRSDCYARQGGCHVPGHHSDLSARRGRSGAAVIC
ncbi:hypothetical protein [Pararhizobium arenae]|uniref:hypothetical protein n=1 Tax=Pararhizobium arenae TaxID=1856850 RepID=UPI00117A797C|nr:hypothetical protein [Pararhizobium arenae]